MLYFFILHFTDKKDRVFETGSVGLAEIQLFLRLIRCAIYIYIYIKSTVNVSP